MYFHVFLCNAGQKKRSFKSDGMIFLWARWMMIDDGVIYRANIVIFDYDIMLIVHGPSELRFFWLALYIYKNVQISMQ